MDPDFLQLKKHLFDPLKLPYSLPIEDVEGRGYAASSFYLNGNAIVFQAAKVTSKKEDMLLVWMDAHGDNFR